MSGRGRGKPAAAASRTPTKAALKSTPKSAGKGRKTYVKVEEEDYEEVSIWTGGLPWFIDLSTYLFSTLFYQGPILSRNS